MTDAHAPRLRGVDAALPAGGSRERWWGLLVEGFDREPNYQCNYSPPYYKDFFETYGFQVQQSRWAKGLTQVAIKLLPTILKSDAPRKVKMEAL